MEGDRDNSRDLREVGFVEGKSILCQGEKRRVLSGGGGACSDNAPAGGDRGGCGERQQMGVRHMGKEDRKKPGGARLEGDAEGRVGEPLWIPKEASVSKAALL